jgi:hypothetical protein
MDKVEALFVRAIKSSSPEFRMKRLYARFYCGNYKDYALSGILLRIVDNYGLMRPYDFVDALNPENSWKYDEGKGDISYHEKLINIFSSYIYCTPISKFEGYPRSAAYRNKVKGEIK